jgi:putative cell wall-binding protein
MPGYDLVAAAEPTYQLTLEARSITGKTTRVASLGFDEIAALCTSKPPRYSYWQSVLDSCQLHTDKAVLLEELFAACDISFEPGDVLLITYSGAGGDPGAAGQGAGKLQSISWETLFAEPRYYYPQISRINASEATLVRPALVLSAAEGTDAFSAASTRADMTGALRLVYGQSEWDLYERVVQAESFYRGITALTVLKGAIRISEASATGIEESYLYSGEEIRPLPVLVGPEGEVLRAGRDYELSYADNIEAGLARVFANGIGLYTAAKEMSFRILRAQSYSGLDRYHTAAQIALDAYPQGSQGAIVASGENLPDAHAATGLAGLLDYPVLLTHTANLNSSTEQALIDLSRANSDFEVIIIGGTPSVSSSTEEMLVLRFGQNHLVRLAGPDRYATALEVLYYGSLVGQWSDTVIVATGTNFADALSASPFAAWSHSPVLICDGKALSDAALADLIASDMRRVVIVGGEPSVSASVQSQLSAVVGEENVIRLAGPDRYATSLAIARWELGQGMGADGVAVAVGEKFPDALAGGALLAKNNAVVLLARPDNTSAYQFLTERTGEINLLRFFGSEASVSMEMRIAATAALGWPEVAQ